jgi:hypothetical protein
MHDSSVCPKWLQIRKRDLVASAVALAVIGVAAVASSLDDDPWLTEFEGAAGDNYRLTRHTCLAIERAGWTTLQLPPADKSRLLVDGDVVIDMVPGPRKRPRRARIHLATGSHLVTIAYHGPDAEPVDPIIRIDHDVAQTIPLDQLRIPTRDADGEPSCSD